MFHKILIVKRMYNETLILVNEIIVNNYTNFRPISAVEIQSVYWRKVIDFEELFSQLNSAFMVHVLTYIFSNHLQV